MHEAKECQKPKDPSQKELPYGKWLKARYWGREEGNTKKGGAPRQPQGPVTSPEKPNRDANPIQTEENINHASNGALNVKSCNSQNVSNGLNIDSPALKDNEALMSEVNGANILGRNSQTDTVIKRGNDYVHGVMDTNTSMNLVSIPVEYAGSKDNVSVTIKQPREKSSDQGKNTAREGGGSRWRRLERSQQPHATTNLVT